MKHISFFGGVADGTGNGDGTPNCEAFQDAAYWLQENRGGCIDFSHDGPGWYRHDTPVTLFHQDSSQFAHYTLQPFGSAKFDASNMSGNDTPWTIGAEELAKFVEIGGFRVGTMIYKGPELAPGYAPGNTPATNTRGFLFQFCGNLHTDGLSPHYFKTGVEKKFCFSSQGSLDVGRNYIGLRHNDSSNDATYSKVNAVNCRFSAVIASDGDYDSGKINNVSFGALRIEDSMVGVVIDPGTVTNAGPIIREISIDNIYNANVEYDTIRAGFQFDFANPGITSSTPGVERTAEISGLYARGGLWNPKNPGWGGSRRAVRLSSNLKVSEVHLEIPVPWGVSGTFDNRPRGGRYVLAGKDGGPYRGFKHIHFDATGNIVPQPNG